jgi:hypothetical protein
MQNMTVTWVSLGLYFLVVVIGLTYITRSSVGHKQKKVQTMSKPNFIVSFDLDGVLYPFIEELGEFLNEKLTSDVWDLGIGSGRMRSALREFSYFQMFRFGKPLMSSERINTLWAAGATVLYVTARRESEREQTQDWLDSYGFRGQLVMNNWKGIPTTMFRGDGNVFMGLDDKPSNVLDMNESGITGYLADFPHSKSFQESNPEVFVVKDADEFCDRVLAEMEMSKVG